MEKKKPADVPLPTRPKTKREQVRQERKRRALLWNVIIFGIGGGVLLLVAWFFWMTARPGAFAGEQLIADEGRAHIQSRNVDLSPTNLRPDFNHYPPSSGTHYGDLVVPWGVYTDVNTIPLPSGLTFANISIEGMFVHNLEHGGVVFLYECPNNACPELQAQFQTLYDKAPLDDRFNSRKILALPYDADKLDTPIVALAWGHQWNTNTFDEATLLQWNKRFVNQGPELAP